MTRTARFPATRSAHRGAVAALCVAVLACLTSIGLAQPAAAAGAGALPASPVAPAAAAASAGLVPAAVPGAVPAAVPAADGEVCGLIAQLFNGGLRYVWACWTPQDGGGTATCKLVGPAQFCDPQHPMMACYDVHDTTGYAPPSGPPPGQDPGPTSPAPTTPGAAPPSATPTPAGPGPAPAAGWHIRYCYDEKNNGDPSGVSAWDGSDPMLFISADPTDGHNSQITGLITFPEVPMGTNPENLSLVGLPTWYWLKSAPMETVGSPAGSIVAHATPVDISVDPGDGSGVFRCPLDATTVTSLFSDKCTHVYTRVSTAGYGCSIYGAAYLVTFTMNYDISFERDGRPYPLPPGIAPQQHSRIGHHVVPVMEAQALNGERPTYSVPQAPAQEGEIEATGCSAVQPAG